MPGAWDRLITEMLRHMIREFMCHPAELLTFRQLAHRIESDSDVLHAIAEQRSELFLITRIDRHEFVNNGAEFRVTRGPYHLY